MSAIEALVHQQPGDGILDNTPDGAETGAVLVATRSDQRQNSVSAAAFAIVLAVVTGIGDQTADAGTDDQGAVQQMGKQPGISLTLAAEATTAKGSPSASTPTWYLVPGLPRSAGFGPTRSPPRLARTLQLSTTASLGALISCGPPRTIRSRRAWTWCRTPVDDHAARRRRKVAPDP